MSTTGIHGSRIIATGFEEKREAPCSSWFGSFLCASPSSIVEDSDLRASRASTNQGGLSMGPKRIAGVVLIIVGIGVAYTGFEMSGTVGDQIGSALKGSPTDSVMLRYVLGAVSAGVGAFLAR